MLEELIVSNLGLIDEASIEPGDGLVVVTGETGTGKTLLLGALGLVTGGTARRDIVGPHGDETVVQARFRVDDGEHVVVRKVGKQGRSRGYLNGVMATARELGQLGVDLVELVAQHDHLRLVSGRHVRGLVDDAFDQAAADARADYDAAYAHWRGLVAKAAALGGDRHALERELEMLRFQVEEIGSAGLRSGEGTELAAAASARRNAAGIAEALGTAMDGLGANGIEPILDQVLLALERVATLDPSLGDVARQALNVALLVGELRSDVASAADSVSGDPAELDAIERRIAEIGDLKRKYGSSVDDVLAFAEQAADRAGQLHGLLSGADELESALHSAETTLRTKGSALLEHRRRIGAGLASSAVRHLQELGFTDPVVEFSVVARDPGRNGCDRIEILFSSSTDLEPKPVGRIASGGELSRLVLAIRLAGGSADGVIAAFDEIDAGVGGAAALALGRKLASLASHRQVLCVTHLPQVAAFADTHVVVSRDGDMTRVGVVDGDDRVAELTRMLAGMPESERGRDHATELLAAAGRDQS